jgi:glycosyltransferase 2 family protein
MARPSTQDHIPMLRSQSLRQTIAPLLALIALAWVTWLLVQDWKGIRFSLVQVNAVGLTLLVLIGTLATFHNSLIFHILLRVIEKQPVSYRFTAKMLFVGQIIRYLPGRIWHIVYHISVARDTIPATVLLRCNLEYMVIITFSAFIVSASVLSLSWGVWLAIGIGTLGWAVLIIGFKQAWHLRLLIGVARLIPSKQLQIKLGNLSILDGRGWRESTSISLILLSSWVIYFFAWQFFAWAWPALAKLNLIELCAYYTLAWMIGFLSMITPAGLGIREGAFVIFTQNSTDESLILLMLVARIWMFFVEILLFLTFIFIPFTPNQDNA